MKNVIPRTVLLVAPVIKTLQRQLAEHFPLLRLYEQDNPVAFLCEQGENVTVVVTRGNVGVANSVLGLLPQAGLVAIFGIGTDAVGLAYVRSRQIAITITSGVLMDDVIDLAVGLLLAGSYQLYQGDRFVHEGRWLSGGMPLATQISGRHTGLLGMGSVGQAIARRAQGFDMQVLYTDRKRIAGLDYQWCVDLHTLAHESDFLVIAASGGGANRGIIGTPVFSVVPARAWLINIACGSLVDEKVLIHALQNGVTAGAGLDVFEQEPQIPVALTALDNVMLRPHVAGATQETRQKMSEVVFANVVAQFVGATLLDAID